LPAPRWLVDQHESTMFGADAMTGEQFQYPLATLLTRTESLLTAEFDQRLAAAGFPDLSFSLGTNVLRHLDTDAGLRVGALAEMSAVTKQAISQQLTHLQAHGYVIVERDPADSRAKAVRLTKRGAESQKAARRLFAELERDWRDRYGHERLRQLRVHLEAILFSGYPDGAQAATDRSAEKE
jgi:DNA-binding MarR family transcriptional regulator